MTKVFTLTSFAAFLTEAAVAFPVIERTALARAGEIVEKEAKRVIGTYEYHWPPLKEATVAQKARGDTPLLETGELRASIGHTVISHNEVQIGSNNDKAVWHELGTSRGIPPRPFLSGALQHKAEEVVEVIGRSVAGYLATGDKTMGHGLPPDPVRKQVL